MVLDPVYGPGNARNSDGAFLRPASGRIRLVCSRCTGGAAATGRI